MRSKFSFKSHPLHPILVSFPVAFFTGALVFDAAYFLTDKEELYTIGYWMQISGIAMGLVAAIPGYIDFLYTVPSKSTGKKRAATHGIINVTVVTLSAIAWFYRASASSYPYIVLLLDASAFALLGVAGWMGGTLVYRNQIGVDVRYAGAGKYKEADFGDAKGSIEVAKADELKVNQMKLLVFNDKRLVLGRTEDGYVVFDDRCTHRGGFLAGGSMICGTVQCPWHGSQFDVRSGAIKAGPAKDKINVYPVSEQNGKIVLQL